METVMGLKGGKTENIVGDKKNLSTADVGDRFVKEKSAYKLASFNNDYLTPRTKMGRCEDGKGVCEFPTKPKQCTNCYEVASKIDFAPFGGASI
jgi:hypothetical protein